jgi:hypothetical protein
MAIKPVQMRSSSGLGKIGGLIASIFSGGAASGAMTAVSQGQQQNASRPGPESLGQGSAMQRRMGGAFDMEEEPYARYGTGALARRYRGVG